MRFHPVLLKHGEFFTTPHTFEFIDLEGGVADLESRPGHTRLHRVPGSCLLSFSAITPSITLELSDGGSTTIEGNLLPSAESRRLFERDGSIRSITVTIPETRL